MKVAPLNFIVAGESNLVGAPAGIYAHAREVAAWLRDNDLDEAADSLDSFAADAEAASTVTL